MPTMGLGRELWPDQRWSAAVMSLRCEDVIRVIVRLLPRGSPQPLKFFSLRTALVAIRMRYRDEHAER
jgi:hypothetical protein